MKYKLLVLGALFGASFVPQGFAMKPNMQKIQMPNAEVLRGRLDECGLDLFAKKTTIVQQLANQEKDALAVVKAVEEAYREYNACLAQEVREDLLNMAIGHMKMNKSMMLEALLQDEPEALEELQLLHLYKPCE